MTYPCLCRYVPAALIVGCFAVGGASVEAYIRMLGCTLTNELSSQMNWAVGDQKISMKRKKNTFRDTRLQDVHGKSPHGPLVLNSVCSNLNPLKVLNILNGMRKALFSRGLKLGDRKWPNMITGLSNR